jgi:hypothetical protein
LLIVATLFRDVKVTRFDDAVRVHTAEETETAFIDTWHPVKEERVNAEVKVTERSKLVLNDVIALSWIVYCDEVERAVLGETLEEVTVKLTCALSVAIKQQRHIQSRKKVISFIRLVLNY